MNTETKNNDEKEQGIPQFALKGAKLPRRALYSALREKWLEKTSLSSVELANVLNVSPQSCSTMATGSDRRIPPMWAILRLCFLLDVYLEVRADSVTIKPLPESEGSDD